MNDKTIYTKPIYLSEEEAMGLLDLCLASGAAIDRAKDSALLKLSDLVRHYLSFRNPHSQGNARQNTPLIDDLSESLQILTSLLDFLTEVPAMEMQNAIHNAEVSAKYHHSHTLLGYGYTSGLHSLID